MPMSRRGLLGSAAAALSILGVRRGAAQSGGTLKVGVLTALIGVPFFLYLIARERRRLAAGPLA